MLTNPINSLTYTQKITNWFSWGKTYLSLAIEAYSSKNNTLSQTAKIAEMIARAPEAFPKVVSSWGFDFETRIFKIFPRLKCTHNIKDPELIKLILRARRDNEYFASGFHRFFDGLIGTENMLLCAEENHRKLRSPMEKIFTKRAMYKDFFFKSISDLGLRAFQLITSWETKKELTLNIESFVFLNMVQNVLGLKLTDEGIEKLKDCFKILHTATYNDEIEQKAKETIKKIIFAQIEKTEKNTVLDALDKNRRGDEKDALSEVERISSILLLLEAGIHTTTSFINLFTESLMDYPEVRKGLYQHWEQHVQNWAGVQDVNFLDKSTYNECFRDFVQNSSYLDACYLEAVRLFPIIPYIRRIATENMNIEQMTVHKSDELILNILAYQRDPQIWGEDAAIFNPQRFLRDDSKSSALLTFSTGSQSCLGKYLAETEAKIFITQYVIFTELNHEKAHRKNKSAFFITEDFSLVGGYNINGFSHSARNEWKAFLQENETI